MREKLGKGKHRISDLGFKIPLMALIKKDKKVILTGKGRVEVYDPSGRLIGRFTVDGRKEIHLKSGVYMFRIDGKIRKEIVR